MTNTREVASALGTLHKIKEILTANSMQNAVSLLIDWFHTGEIKISYYHFIHICDFLKEIGIRITTDNSILKYAAGYLLLPKSEEIMNVSIEYDSHETNNKIRELVYAAVQESIKNLELLSIQLFISS
jgi:hypothetical protein